MKRVKVDFSTTVKGGMIRASQRRASETLHPGDPVEAFDPSEDISFIGVVDTVSDDGRFAYLRLEWESRKHIPVNEPGQNMFAFAGMPVVATRATTASERGAPLPAPTASPAPTRPMAPQPAPA